MIICPAMRLASAPRGIDVSKGYYLVHDMSTDADTQGFDDHHQNDIAHVLMRAMERPTDSMPLRSRKTTAGSGSSFVMNSCKRSSDGLAPSYWIGDRWRRVAHKILR